MAKRKKTKKRITKREIKKKKKKRTNLRIKKKIRIVKIKKTRLNNNLALTPKKY